MRKEKNKKNNVRLSICYAYYVKFLNAISVAVSSKNITKIQWVRNVFLALATMFFLSILTGSVFLVILTLVIFGIIRGVSLYSFRSFDSEERSEDHHNYGSNGSNGSDGSTGS